MREKIFPIPETWPSAQVSASFFACLPSESAAQGTGELKQRERYVRDVANSNRKFDVSLYVACSRLSDSGEDPKEKGTRKVGGAFRFIFVFLLSQFSRPDYIGDTFVSHNRSGSRIFFRRGCTCLLLYFNTNKPHSFFLQNTTCIRKRQVIWGGGGCAPPAPSP